MLSKDKVEHVAKLARLELSDENAERFSSQLSDVLSYMEILDEVNTEGVEPTLQVTGLINVSREDKVKKWCPREDLLAASELPVEINQIRVKPVITNN